MTIAKLKKTCAFAQLMARMGYTPILLGDLTITLCILIVVEVLQDFFFLCLEFHPHPHMYGSLLNLSTHHSTRVYKIILHMRSTRPPTIGLLIIQFDSDIISSNYNYYIIIEANYFELILWFD